jgi:RNA polymerase sigma factor (sigma-70 family)
MPSWLERGEKEVGLMGRSHHQHALTCRAAAGDENALTVLLTQSRDRLRDRITRRTPAWLSRLVDAEDVVQDTHVEAFRQIRTFEPHDSTSFDRWLAVIAVRRLRACIQHYRALKRGGGLDRISADWRLGDSSLGLWDTLVGPGRTPSRSAARHEVIATVRVALDALPAHYRKAVWIVHMEGRPARDAADEMGRTERAIHGLCRRGLAQMRKHLQSVAGGLSSAH